MDAVALSFVVIFVAELGDKSQLLALALATRYRALPVLAGISLATAANHLLSVTVGAALGANLPGDAVSVMAGLAFLGFAAWTLRGDRLEEGDVERATRAGRSAFATAAVAFFVAELGDKTMLATITLASAGGVAGTFVGSTLGMVAADALAIGVGRQLGSRLPERAVRTGAAAAFVVFGLLLLGQPLLG